MILLKCMTLRAIQYCLAGRKWPVGHRLESSGFYIPPNLPRALLKGAVSSSICYWIFWRPNKTMGTSWKTQTSNSLRKPTQTTWQYSQEVLMAAKNFSAWLKPSWSGPEQWKLSLPNVEVWPWRSQLLSEQMEGLQQPTHHMIHNSK